MTLDQIVLAEARLTDRYRDRLTVNHDLDRTLVSFQANHTETEHRWYKYKEGFSASLVRYILDRMDLERGHVLDPFAGSGTTLFTASERRLAATGMELLPCSAEIIAVRNLIWRSDRPRLAADLRRFAGQRHWEKPGGRRSFPHLKITSGAFPAETELALERYLYEADHVSEPTLQRVLRFAAMCVLEQVSYTRKDGQYLRWDARSGRTQRGRAFNKGKIDDFTSAIQGKLSQLADDLESGEPGSGQVCGEPFGQITLHPGSCLELLPQLASHSFEALVTSPPYCNRYDYTRTYALELAMLGVNEDELKRLRQTMLSCTVENRAKDGLDARFETGIFESGLRAFQAQRLLHEVLNYLEGCRTAGRLNNSGIPRMVRNYFLELAVVISDWARILKPGASLIMVNDNVRYQGVHIPVDLILADIAEQVGFEISAIWVLPKGKGNSSQQMSLHGRSELRKCVYVWRSKDCPPRTCLS